MLIKSINRIKLHEQSERQKKSLTINETHLQIVYINRMLLKIECQVQ